MFSRRRTIRHSEWVRRLVCLGVLFSLCVSFVPLPRGSSLDSIGDKDHSEPFPCQDRPCGCRSAQQCWKKCCCFTNEQKLVWARRNQVKVPAFVLVRAKAEAATSRISAPAVFSVRKIWKTCCSSHRGESRVAENSVKPRRVPSSRTNVVIGVLAQQCQGGGPYWNSLPWSILSTPLEVRWPSSFLMEALPASTLLLSEVTFSPPVPPPRSV